MSFKNRLANANNEFQGDTKRVLCLCSAGLLRSPTAALVLSQEPYNYNTRAAGVSDEYALIPVDEVLLHWADEIVCVEERIKDALVAEFDVGNTPIKVLNIPDNYEYRDPVLMKLIKEDYDNTLRDGT